MRAVTAVSIVLVLFGGLAVLVQEKDPSITMSPAVAGEAHLVSLDESWDYAGEQAALEHRRQTQIFEYRKQRSESEQNQNQDHDPEGEGDREDRGGDRQGHGHQGMSYPAQAVAACESGQRRANGTAVIGSHRWHIGNHHGGTDSGAFQFLDSTWRWVAREVGASQYARAKHAPPQVQVKAFQWLWHNGGPHHWNPSRSCWGPML